MPFDSYTNFRTTVSTFLDVSDVTPTAVDDLIRMGEQRVNRLLRVRQMETALNVTIGAQGVAAMPSDYMDLSFCYINSSPISRLEKKSAEWIYGTYNSRSAVGRPHFIAEQGSNFIFGPAPDSAYVLSGTYYAKPGSLPGTATINAVFTEYPELYLYATLAEAEPFLGRDQRMVWEQKFQQRFDDVKAQDRRRRFAGTPLAVTVA